MIRLVPQTSGPVPTPAKDALPPPSPLVQSSAPAFSLETLVLLTITIRIAAYFALRQPLESDGLAYFSMAKAMAAGMAPVDNFGQHAFYSVGYPAVLTPFFALFGASMATAIMVNLALAGISALLVLAIARQCRLPILAGQLAMLGYALWLPGIWSSTMLARENLSTPLLLATALLALRLLENPRASLALATGAVWGAAVLAGSSALPLILAPLLALTLACCSRLTALASPMLALGMGAALMLAPWGLATHQMLGQATLSTNTGFNLYIGNNPAANGRFVSIADTPAGPVWHQLLAERGEAGATKELGRSAIAYMLENPKRTVLMDLRKLMLFWAPNLPDTADFTSSKAVALVRVGEVAQYLLLISLGFFALFNSSIAGRQRAVLALLITGFWSLHGLAYIIARYRDPVMPLLIVLTAGLVVQIVQNWSALQDGSDGEASNAA